jgi:hypothetical protein
MDFPSILLLMMIWLGCSLLNLFWYKHHPHAIAEEFHVTLILVAPLASFFIVLSVVGVCLYNVPLKLMGIHKADF